MNKVIPIIAVSLAIASVFFFFSFSGFSTVLISQDVVDQDQIFFSTDQTAVDGFVDDLSDTLTDDEQGVGVILTVVMKDSNGKIIPQEQNFLTVPIMTSLISTNNGALLDFAKLQFDFEAVLVKNDRIGEITVDYEMTMNRSTPFLKGTAFGSGTTTNNRLNLDFEQGTKRGNAIELDFEKGEVPVKIVTGQSFTNTLDVTVTKVSALVGTNFGTQQYQWTGVFPVYKLKFDADAESRTVRDYRGIAIQTLPNDITISTSSSPATHQNNYRGGTVDYAWSATTSTITVTKLDGTVIAKTSGGIVGGIPRGETLLFTLQHSHSVQANDLPNGGCVGGFVGFFCSGGASTQTFTITTPESQRAYTAGCSGIPRSCTNNFGG